MTLNDNTNPSFPTLQKDDSRLQLRISERRVLLMFGDALAIFAAIMISLAIWAFVADEPFDVTFIAPQWGWFVVLPLLWFVLASANDFYRLSIAASRSASMQRLTVITLQVLVLYVVVFFFSDRDALPRLFIIYYGVSSFLLIMLWRLLNPALIGWASAPRRALIVGTDWTAETIIDTLTTHASDSYHLLGVIGSNDAPETVRDLKVVGKGSDLLRLVDRLDVSELIVTSTRELPGDIFQGVMDAYEHGVAITPMPLLYERLTERVPVEHVGDSWAVVLPISGSSAFNPYPFMKRLMDVVLSIIGLIVFVLLLPFIALAIWLDSPGSIFYRQERVGLNGRVFDVIKLRTMIPDAEAKTGAVFAQKNDPRITRTGRFMRKTRLDELPQLWNVLKGDMSLIGPRPERPQHIDRLQQKIPFYRTRHIIRPGVTGWAQVRYKYGDTDEDALVKLQYDLYYIRHQSVLLDVSILVRTVGRVLKMGGQ